MARYGNNFGGRGPADYRRRINRYDFGGDRGTGYGYTRAYDVTGGYGFANQTQSPRPGSERGRGRAYGAYERGFEIGPGRGGYDVDLRTRRVGGPRPGSVRRSAYDRNW